MNKYDDVRHALIGLPYSKITKAVPYELVVDYNKGNLYTKDRDNNIIELGTKEMIDLVDDVGERIIGYNKNISSFVDIIDIIRYLDEWRESIDDLLNIGEYIDDINKVFKKLVGVSNGTTINSLLEGKLRKNNEGKVLSDNDFTNLLLDKLNNIEHNANKYFHPVSRVCTENIGVNSLNFRQGHTYLTKDDIGLKNIDYRANNYIHPPEIICNITDAVNSINGKTGYVYLDKIDIGLEYIENWGIANEMDVLTSSGQAYLTPWSYHKVIEMFPLFKCGRIFIGHKMYGGMKVDGQYFIRAGDFYSLDIPLEKITDMSMGKFVTILNDNGTISIYKMYENSLKYYKPKDYPEGNEYVMIGRCKGFLGAAVKEDGTHIRWGMEDVDRVVSDLINIDFDDMPVKIDGHSTFLSYLFGSGKIGVYGKSAGIGATADYVPFVPLYDKFIDMSCGIDFISCVREDGTLETFGKDTIENGYITKYSPPGIFTQVASGDYHSIALREDGVILAWGYNNKNIWDVPGGRFIQIDSYGDTNIALSDKGMIHIWGAEI